MASTAARPIQAITKADSLKLVIPDEIKSKQRWAPHRYGPSIILTRVPSLPHLEIPPPRPIVTETDVFDGQTLSLTKFIGGGLYDYYYASYDGGDLASLVAMLVDLSHFTVSEQLDVKEWLVQEVFLYSRLSSVQGRYVPRFGGLFNHGSLYCLVFEDAGPRLRYTRTCKTDGTMDKVMEAVKGINEAGVSVYTERWYNLNRGTDGTTVMMTTFNNVVTIERYTPEFCAKLAAKKKGKMANYTPQEWLARDCKGGRKFILEELFDEYD